MKWLLPNILTKVKVVLKNFNILYRDIETLQILGYPCLCILKLNSLKICRTNEK